MELFNFTIERIVALVVVVLQLIAALLFAQLAWSRGALGLVTIALCLPGLLIIWFREGLSATAFDRGVMRESPPLLVDLFGWIFLLGLPVLFLYGLLP